MRGRGDPDQVDPIITASGVIDVRYPQGFNPKSQREGGSGNACATYLTMASAALGGELPVQIPSKMVSFSVCMRAHGILDFPDPTDTGGTYHFPIGVRFNNNGTPMAAPGTPIDLDPTNPTLQNDAKLCAQKVGVPQWGYTRGSAPGSVVAIVNSGD